MNIRRSDVLGTNSDPDGTRRNPLQDRPSLHQFQLPGNCDRLITGEHSADNAILSENLNTLYNASGKFAPPLHFFETRGDAFAGDQRPSKNVGRSNRVLHGKIDSYAADG